MDTGSKRPYFLILVPLLSPPCPSGMEMNDWDGIIGKSFEIYIIHRISFELIIQRQSIQNILDRGPTRSPIACRGV